MTESAPRDNWEEISLGLVVHAGYPNLRRHRAMGRSMPNWPESCLFFHWALHRLLIDPAESIPASDFLLQPWRVLLRVLQRRFEAVGSIAAAAGWAQDAGQTGFSGRSSWIYSRRKRMDITTSMPKKEEWLQDVLRVRYLLEGWGSNWAHCNPKYLIRGLANDLKIAC